jgi:hypothetical protein
MKLEPGDGSIQFAENGTITTVVKCNPVLIKLIKTCVALSYSVNEDYSTVVSAFVHELIKNCENINLPLSLPKNNKTQKIIAEELNQYLKELCEKNDIHYSEIIDAPKRLRKSKASMLEAASMAGTSSK